MVWPILIGVASQVVSGYLQFKREEKRNEATLEIIRENQNRALRDYQEQSRRERDAMSERFDKTIQEMQINHQKQLQQVVKEMEQKFEEERQRQAEERKKFREEYPRPWYLTAHKNKINVCVTGVSGSGKSTLLNILRDVSPGDEGYAEVGTNEQTIIPTVYQLPNNHPFYGQVQLWDLPGAGMEQFPQETYVQDMGIRWYDACIVVGDTRVRKEDVALIKEMERTYVRFLYVRTKMDHQVEDNMDEKNLNSKETFKEVRDFLIHQKGIMQPYLIGRNFIRKGNLNDWENEDFKALQEDLLVMISNSAMENNNPLNVNGKVYPYDNLSEDRLV